MPAIKPFLCRECGESSPENFFWRTVNGEKKPTSKSLCKVHMRAYNNQNHKKTHAKVSDRVIRAKYGISMKEYEDQLAAQGGRCAACQGRREDDIENRGRRWPVDHDHETGAVRGILCWLCNLALGAVRDSPATLRSLADYAENGGVWQCRASANHLS